MGGYATVNSSSISSIWMLVSYWRPLLLAYCEPVPLLSLSPSNAGGSFTNQIRKTSMKTTGSAPINQRPTSTSGTDQKVKPPYPESCQDHYYNEYHDGILEYLVDELKGVYTSEKEYTKSRMLFPSPLHNRCTLFTINLVVQVNSIFPTSPFQRVLAICDQ
jgi:hypothetical protein